MLSSRWGEKAQIINELTDYFKPLSWGLLGQVSGVPGRTVPKPGHKVPTWNLPKLCACCPEQSATVLAPLPGRPIVPSAPRPSEIHWPLFLALSGLGQGTRSSSPGPAPDRSPRTPLLVGRAHPPSLGGGAGPAALLLGPLQNPGIRGHGGTDPWLVPARLPCGPSVGPKRERLAACWGSGSRGTSPSGLSEQRRAVRAPSPRGLQGCGCPWV